MGTLSQLQTLLTITAIVLGGLMTFITILMANKMSGLKDTIMEKVDSKFKSADEKMDAKFAEVKKEMHDTMITKDYFNGKFDLLNQKIDLLFSHKLANNNEGK